MCYIVPMKWSFAGFATQIFAGRDWHVSGFNKTSITGEYILDNFFDLKDVDSWAMFAILIAYVFFFRFMQYILMAWQTGNISFSFVGKKKAAPTAGKLAFSGVANGKDNYNIDEAIEMKRVGVV